MPCARLPKGIRYVGGRCEVQPGAAAPLVAALAVIAMATLLQPCSSLAAGIGTPTPVPNVRQLTADTSWIWIGSAHINARISDDGSVVVYDEGGKVFVAATDGHDRHVLTPQGTCWQAYPSADGAQVAMVCSGPIGDQNGDGNSEIVLLNGSGWRAITTSQPVFFNSSPSMSADGQTIVFTSNANYGGDNAGGTEQVFLWHGGQIQTLSHSAEDNREPLISGDGHSILFQRSHDLYLYNDQTGESLLIRSIAGSAQLSRDGHAAVFSARAMVLGSNGGQLTELYRQPIGGAAQQLSQTFNYAGSRLSDFAVNADASRIAAVFSNRGIGEGLLFTPEGLRALPGVPSDAWSLSFDAAGRRLAFRSGEDLTGQNPNRLQQLFVADIPLDPGPPVNPTPTPHPTAGPPCPGDCSDDGQVTVDELLAMVNIALGGGAASVCPAGDLNDSNSITVDEILTGVNAALSGCPHNGTPMDEALRALSAGDVHLANAQFCRAATAAPSDAFNFYCAATELIPAILEDAQMQSLARRSGISLAGDSQDICSWHAALPHDAPSDAPTLAEIVATLHDVLLPQIDGVVSTLDQLPDNAEIVFDLANLPYCLWPRDSARAVHIDHGDILAATAGLKIARAWLNMLTAYDLDISLARLVGETPQHVLADAPALLTLTAAASLGAGRQDVADVLTRAAAAITSVLGEVGDQSADLLVIAPQDRDGAERTVRVLDLIRQSLQGQVVFSTDVGLQQPFRLDLSKLFSGQFPDLRPLLPGFNGSGQFDFADFADPTFGGMAPDLTQMEISRALLGDNCWYTVVAADQAECDAAGAQRGCRSAYFYPWSGYTNCSLGGCICGWPGD